MASWPSRLVPWALRGALIRSSVQSSFKGRTAFNAVLPFFLFYFQALLSADFLLFCPS